MASLKLDIALTFNRFAEIADNLKPVADLISRKTAFDIQADYQLNARRDTGAQVNSAYVVTDSDSTYSQAVIAAHAANPAVRLLPEVQAQPHEVLIAIGVDYAYGNEYGVHGRAGDGALTQATERHRQAYNDAMSSLLEQAARR